MKQSLEEFLSFLFSLTTWTLNRVSFSPVVLYQLYANNSSEFQMFRLSCLQYLSFHSYIYVCILSYSKHFNNCQALLYVISQWVGQSPCILWSFHSGEPKWVSEYVLNQSPWFPKHIPHTFTFIYACTDLHIKNLCCPESLTSNKSSLNDLVTQYKNVGVILNFFFSYTPNSSSFTHKIYSEFQLFS